MLALLEALFFATEALDAVSGVKEVAPHFGKDKSGKRTRKTMALHALGLVSLIACCVLVAIYHDALSRAVWYVGTAALFILAGFAVYVAGVIVSKSTNRGASGKLRR